jgi:hypothetical protein
VPEFELKDFFGQVLLFITVNIPPSPEHRIQPDTLAYAVIKHTKISEPATDHCMINYYKDLGPKEFVDLNQIRCIVGRIMDRGQWAIIDRNKQLAYVHTSS